MKEDTIWRHKSGAEGYIIKIETTPSAEPNAPNVVVEIRLPNGTTHRDYAGYFRRVKVKG